MRQPWLPGAHCCSLPDLSTHGLWGLGFPHPNDLGPPVASLWQRKKRGLWVLSYWNKAQLH